MMVAHLDSVIHKGKKMKQSREKKSKYLFHTEKITPPPTSLNPLCSMAKNTPFNTAA